MAARLPRGEQRHRIRAMRRPRLEFFFDCSSPWTYLAFDRIEMLATEVGAELIWRPILVGGVFNAVNRSVYEQRSSPVPAKLHYAIKDLQDWARKYGLHIGAPPVFPVNSVQAMRGWSRFEVVQPMYNLVKRQAAVLLPDRELASQLLVLVRDLIHDAPRREAMGQALRKLSHPQAAQELAGLLRAMLGREIGTNG